MNGHWDEQIFQPQINLIFSLYFIIVLKTRENKERSIFISQCEKAIKMLNTEIIS
jgi:hypothetical protein